MRLLVGLVALTLAGCASQAQTSRTPVTPGAHEGAQAEEKRPGDHLEVGGKTTLASFALSGRVTVQAFWAVGAAVGGLFEDGFDGAERRWDARIEAMRDVARIESDKVVEAGRSPKKPVAKNVAKR